MDKHQGTLARNTKAAVDTDKAHKVIAAWEGAVQAVVIRPGRKSMGYTSDGIKAQQAFPGEELLLCNSLCPSPDCWPSRRNPWF
jgi:hypothetical protein